MQSIERFILIHGTLLFALGVVLAVFNPDYFQGRYVTEDGVLEWLTVLALGTAAVVTAGRLRQGFRHFTWMQNVTLSCICVLAVFGAGEELSWGQRLIGTDVPEFFLTHNAQEETNLHNLFVADINVNKHIFARGFLALFLFYLLVMTPLYHRSASVRALLDFCGIPMPKRYQIIGYFVIIILVEGLLNIVHSDLQRRGELTEFAVPVLAVLNIIYPLNASVFATGKDRMTQQ
ncbi:MAG: hypothetical protein OXF74_04420 [Rhodobacteraceae bacterium]|nr:hypothetical protein [Paracoccaceae bacterium]